jgi:hypothetical protein
MGVGDAKNKPVAVLLKLEHARLIDQLAAMKDMTSSELIVAALAAYISPDVRRLERQLERLERGQTLVLETLALFIRDYLAGTTPVVEANDLMARAQSRVRFGQFIEQLACHLQQ